MSACCCSVQRTEALVEPLLELEMKTEKIPSKSEVASRVSRLSELPAYSKLYKTIEQLPAQVDERNWLKGVLDQLDGTANPNIPSDDGSLNNGGISCAPPTIECLQSRCSAAVALLNAVRVNVLETLGITEYSEAPLCESNLVCHPGVVVEQEGLEARKNVLQSNTTWSFDFLIIQFFFHQLPFLQFAHFCLNPPCRCYSRSSKCFAITPIYHQLQVGSKG